MLHLLLYGALAIVIAGLLFALAARFLPAGEQIAPPVRDEPPWELPADRAMRPDEVDAVRLPVALRGYRFAETDTLLDRLADELRARDAEIARLRGHSPYAGEDEEQQPEAAESQQPEAAEETKPEPAEEAPAAVEPDEQLEEELAVDADVDDVPGPDDAAAVDEWAVTPPPWAVTRAKQHDDDAAAPGEVAEPATAEVADPATAEVAEPAPAEVAEPAPAEVAEPAAAEQRPRRRRRK